MNILLINHYAGSPEMGMEFRPYYFAKEWIKMGHTVHIIGASFSHLRRINPQVEYDFQAEIIDGINYHWIKTGEYEGNGVKRAKTMWQFVSKLWKNMNYVLKEMEPDMVICSSTYPLDTYIGQKLKKKSEKNVKLIHEVHDMWPATLIEVGGMSKFHPFVIAMQIGENSAYRNSDKVVSFLSHAEEYMLAHGLAKGKFSCIPNGVIMEEWEDPLELPESHKAIFEELKKQKKHIVGYFGGHALSNQLHEMLDVAKSTEDHRIHFVLVGDGVEKKKLIIKKEKEGIENVTFLEPINKEAIPSLCKELDIIYFVSQIPMEKFGASLNKMFDAMASGKPAIFTKANPPMYIESHNCGIAVNPEKIEDIISAIDTVVRMSDKEKLQISKNGRDAVNGIFSYEKLAKKFIDVIGVQN